MSSYSVQNRPRQLKMVAWYNPAQLCRTAVSVIVSLLFGRHSDFRLIEALGTPDSNVHDYSNIETQEDFWIDYVADLGDGWNSTYAIAYHAAQPHLMLQDSEGNTHDTQRGSVLIFGGDAVYPVAGRAQYRDRTVNPYAVALAESLEPHPDIYVIPGNHDWYDSLVTYKRLFCSKRWFAGWRTQQERSYFALKLPYRWWLIGIDIQLDSDLDDLQVNFFSKVAADMQDEDKVILCVAEPGWIYEKLYGTIDSEYNENNIVFLEEVLFQKKISIFLSGDLHHYRRHESPDGTQKIVAGGGGAFLHPTHGQDVSILPGGFALKASFPDITTSKRLGWRNVCFLFLNPSFGVLTGLFYLLTLWSSKTDLSGLGIHDWKMALETGINQALKTPVGTFWIILAILSFIAFTDTHSRMYRITAGFLHGLAHLLAAFFIGWGVIRLCHDWGFLYDSTPQLLLSGALIFVGGWIIGSCIMGVYLFISLNVFGRQSNEAFSSLAIQDWKNFIRIKITPAGEMSIYPIGIRRVPRQWKRRESSATGSCMVPDDPKATHPELIEKPIQVQR